jgi:guanylate kinase
MKGLLLILSGPSGVGKSTIHGIFKEKNQDFKLSVSVTTRRPRPGEVEGVNYYYRTNEEFDELLRKNAFIEHVEFSGNRYGTLKSEIDRITKGGDNVVLDVEAVGALNIKKQYPEAILIFILPPSFEVLSQRLTKRASESKAEVDQRLSTFRYQTEMAVHYDYVVVNDDVNVCAEQVQKILSSERQGRKVEELLVCNNISKIKSLIKEN